MINAPVVLITGALTASGALQLWPSRRKAPHRHPGRRVEEGAALGPNYAGQIEKRSPSAPTSVEEEKVRRLVNRAVDVSPLDVTSTTPVPEVSPARDRAVHGKLRRDIRYQCPGYGTEHEHELRIIQSQGHGSVIDLSSTIGHKAAPGASIYTATSTPSKD